MFVRRCSIYFHTHPALSRYLYTPCFDVLHLPPVAAQSYPGEEEAADVDGDEGGHDEVVVEELRGLGEAQLGLVFGLDEALEGAHVGSGGLARPDLVHQSCYSGENHWEALCIQTIQQQTCHRYILWPAGIMKMSIVSSVSTITFCLYLIVLIWEKVLAMLIAIALVQKKKAIKV